jgi:hypothetical protein
MPPNDQSGNKIDRFILEEIDSVPHLEALLLLWNNRSHSWSVEAMAKALFVSAETAGQVLQDLASRQFTMPDAKAPECFCYRPNAGEREELLALLDTAYRRDLIRITKLIHSKASSPLSDFARAFQFRKDRD